MAVLKIERYSSSCNRGPLHRYAGTGDKGQDILIKTCASVVLFVNTVTLLPTDRLQGRFISAHN